MLARIRKWFRRTPQVRITVVHDVSADQLIREIQRRERNRARHGL